MSNVSVRQKAAPTGKTASTPNAAREILQRRSELRERLAKLTADYKSASDELSALSHRRSEKLTELKRAQREADAEAEVNYRNGGVEPPRLRVLRDRAAGLDKETDDLEKQRAAAEKRRDELNAEIRKLQTEELPAAEFGVELAGILAHQKAIAAAGAAVDAIEASIAKTRDELQRLEAGVPNLVALYERREDLLAAFADGHVTPGELEAHDAEIAKGRKAADKAQTEIERARATLAGLERGLKVAQTEHEDRRDERSELLRCFLFSEAQVLEANYVEHAKAVRGYFLKLMGLNKLLQAVTGVGGHGPLVRYAAEFRLPAFALPHCQELTGPRSPGELFTGRGYTLPQDIEEAARAERDRLRALGVEI